jgi:hypothetical protein
MLLHKSPPHTASHKTQKGLIKYSNSVKSHKKTHKNDINERQGDISREFFV